MDHSPSPCLKPIQCMNSNDSRTFLNDCFLSQEAKNVTSQHNEPMKEIPDDIITTQSSSPTDMPEKELEPVLFANDGEILEQNEATIENTQVKVIEQVSLENFRQYEKNDGKEYTV